MISAVNTRHKISSCKCSHSVGKRHLTYKIPVSRKFLDNFVGLELYFTRNTCLAEPREARGWVHRRSKFWWRLYLCMRFFAVPLRLLWNQKLGKILTVLVNYMYYMYTTTSVKSAKQKGKKKGEKWINLSGMNASLTFYNLFKQTYRYII